MKLQKKVNIDGLNFKHLLWVSHYKLTKLWDLVEMPKVSKIPIMSGWILGKCTVYTVFILNIALSVNVILLQWWKLETYRIYYEVYMRLTPKQAHTNNAANQTHECYKLNERWLLGEPLTSHIKSLLKICKHNTNTTAMDISTRKLLAFFTHFFTQQISFWRWKEITPPLG